MMWWRCTDRADVLLGLYSAVFTQCSNSTAELLRLHSHLLRWTTPEMDSISFFKYTLRAEHAAAHFKISVSVLTVGLADIVKKKIISVLLVIFFFLLSTIERSHRNCNFNSHFGHFQLKFLIALWSLDTLHKDSNLSSFSYF